jgi:lipoprotein signal peptidase
MTRASCLAVVVAVVAADQFAKTQAIAPARNIGVLTGATPISGVALIAVSVMVLAVFLSVIGRWAVQIGVTPLAPALVAGGMFAHTLDRIRFGGVRDFVRTPWLIIDVADLAVVLGVALLLAAGAVRAYQLHRESRTIAFDAAHLRLVVRDA